MRRPVLLLLCLAACGEPLERGEVLRGRVLRVDADRRELGPAAGVRVTASGTVRGTVTTSKDGSFEFPLPGGVFEWIQLSVEDDEVIGTPPTDLRPPGPEGEVVLRIPAADPDAAPRVRRRLEALRTSARKHDFTYGMDASDHMDDPDKLVMSLSDEAGASRSARKALQEYQKDRDPQLRALAYGVLAWMGECEDDGDRPKQAEGSEAGRMLEWAFRAVATSKHGGHFDLHTNIDCTRCAGIFEDCVTAARSLGAEASKRLESLGKAEGQPAILRAVLEEELRRNKPARGR